MLALGLLGGQAVAQIANSKHDLSNTSTATIHSTVANGTAEICVFCHTPHGASASAPLWNRGASAATGFTMYSSATLDSSVLTLGSNSAACMSCHDGVTALDLIINASGSGGYNAGGLSAGYTWSSGGGLIPAGVTSIGGGAATADLSNDHPIGVAYCGGITAPATCADKDFKLAALNRKVGTTVTTGTGAAIVNAGATDQFWIDTTATGATGGVRDKTDLILYVRAFAGGNQPSVECASCHEPHNGGATGTPFLRISNAASAVCTTCHDK